MHPPPVLDSDRELMDQAKEELAVLPDEAQSPHSSLDPRLSYSSSLPKDSLVRTDIAHAKAETPTPLNTTTQERAVHWVGTKFNTVKNADDTIIGTVRLTRQRSPIDSADATVPWISSETIDDGTPPPTRQHRRSPEQQLRRSSTGDKVVKWLNLSSSVVDPQATASVEKRQVFESGNNFFEVIWTDKAADGDDESSEAQPSSSQSSSSKSDAEGHTSSRASDWNWGYHDASVDKQLRLKRVNTLLSRWKKRQKRKEKAINQPHCREIDPDERRALKFGRFHAVPGPSKIPGVLQSESTTPDRPELVPDLRRTNSEPKMATATSIDEDDGGLSRTQDTSSRHMPEIVVHRDSVAINHERLLRRLKRQATPRPPLASEVKQRRKIKFSDDEGAMPAVQESDEESESSQETPGDPFPTTVIIADKPKSKPTSKPKSKPEKEQPDLLVVRYLG